jgi:hypothetical protein
MSIADKQLISRCRLFIFVLLRLLMKMFLSRAWRRAAVSETDDAARRIVTGL